MQNTALHTFMNLSPENGTRAEPVPKVGQAHAFTAFLETALDNTGAPDSPFQTPELFEEAPAIAEDAVWVTGQGLAVPMQVPVTESPVTPAAPIALNAKASPIWHDIQFLGNSHDGTKMDVLPSMGIDKTIILPSTPATPSLHGQVTAATIPSSVGHPIPKPNLGTGELATSAGNMTIEHGPVVTDGMVKEGGIDQKEPNKAADPRTALNQTPDKPGSPIGKATQSPIADSNQQHPDPKIGETRIPTLIENPTTASNTRQRVSPTQDRAAPATSSATATSNRTPNQPSFQKPLSEPEPSIPPQAYFPQKQALMPNVGENTTALLSEIGTKPARTSEVIKAEVTPNKIASEPISALREIADQNQASLSGAHPIISDRINFESITIKQEPALARQIASQITQVAQTLPNSPVQLVLNPEELGRVRLSFTTENGALTVAVTTERPETLDLMRRHIDALAQDLRNIGYRQVSFDFSQGGANNGASTSDQPAKSSETSTAKIDQAQADPTDESTDSSPYQNAQANSANGVDLRL